MVRDEMVAIGPQRCLWACDDAATNSTDVQQPPVPPRGVGGLAYRRSDHRAE